MTGLVKRHAFEFTKHSLLLNLWSTLREPFTTRTRHGVRRGKQRRLVFICTRSHCTMSTALVSAFYDINDVIQQSKQRPSSLDFRQRIERKTSGAYIPRRHSTVSASVSPKGHLFGGNGTFYALPNSPTEKTFSVGAVRDRSLSASVQEEVEAQHRVNKRGSTNSTRYKTELCRPFEENGTCKYGDKCQFAHGIHELRNMSRHPKYKTELCRTYHTIGFCPYGPRCHFIHNDEEKRAPPTPSSHRSASVSSIGSGPPSPILDPLPSPFSTSLTPPASPGYGGDVFVFGDDTVPLTNSPPQPCTPTSASPPLHIGDAGSYSPPRQSDFGPLSPVAIGKTSPARLPTPSPPLILEEERPSDYRVPQSPGDSRRNGARLPIFSQIA